MKKEIITRLHASFEGMLRTDPEFGTEFWLARDLQTLLGYAKWENFIRVVEKARLACQNSGHEVKDHFLDIRKMVAVGSGAQRSIDDIALTRYACYLIAQSGDPAKTEIAFAQTYFAVQTRKQEIVEERLAQAERLSARKKLTHSEKELSGLIYERIGNEATFAVIRSKGDMVLFGGLTTQDMKKRLGIPHARPLADFLPTITIKAKDFATEITNFNIKKEDLFTETMITKEHVKNNADVRKLLRKRGITPEDLPAAEDIKKVEKRLKSEQKDLPKHIGQGGKKKSV
ncbi:MAG TPA: DNA damage-inducible protein D [Candidatus Hydrogenedentes bacterium]|nr:DNA damage-inducible protein D [Candidatus Hydrogenedentota bacterium]